MFWYLKALINDFLVLVVDLWVVPMLVQSGNVSNSFAMLNLHLFHFLFQSQFVKVALMFEYHRFFVWQVAHFDLEVIIVNKPFYLILGLLETNLWEVPLVKVLLTWPLIDLFLKRVRRKKGFDIGHDVFGKLHYNTKEINS